jgi:hypothetical protein
MQESVMDLLRQVCSETGATASPPTEAEMDIDAVRDTNSDGGGGGGVAAQQSGEAAGAGCQTAAHCDQQGGEQTQDANQHAHKRKASSVMDEAARQAIKASALLACTTSHVALHACNLHEAVTHVIAS